VNDRCSDRCLLSVAALFAPTLTGFTSYASTLRRALMEAIGSVGCEGVAAVVDTEDHSSTTATEWPLPPGPRLISAA